MFASLFRNLLATDFGDIYQTVHFEIYCKYMLQLPTWSARRHKVNVRAFGRAEDRSPRASHPVVVCKSTLRSGELQTAGALR